MKAIRIFPQLMILIYVMRIKKKGFDEKDVITTLSTSERGEYEKFKKEILKILVKY